MSQESRYGSDYFERAYRDYAAQNPPRKLRFYARLLEAHLGAGTPRRVHDLGCGFGLFLAALGDSWERFGSDVSEHAVARAHAACPDATLRVASASSIPADFPDFGAITAFDVIEHVADRNAVRATVLERLVPGGLLLLVVPVYDGASGPLIRRLDRDPTHVHRTGRRAWLDWAAAAFEVVEWGGILRYLLPAGPYVHLPTRALRDHTPAIWVACRKRP